MAPEDLGQSLPSKPRSKVTVLIGSVLISHPRHSSSHPMTPSGTESITTSVFPLDHVCIVAYMSKVEMAAEKRICGSATLEGFLPCV